jgi:hypothetical protein
MDHLKIQKFIAAILVAIFIVVACYLLPGKFCNEVFTDCIKVSLIDKGIKKNFSSCNRTDLFMNPCFKDEVFTITEAYQQAEEKLNRTWKERCNI